MFTQEASSFLQSAFSWIWSFINIHPVGLNISLWQFAVGLFVFRIVFKLILNLIGVGIGSSKVTYRSSSYHGKKESVYDNWNTEDTDWNSDW